MGLQLRPAMADALDSSTSNMNDTSMTEQWEQLAKDLWLSTSSASNVRPEIILRKIWEPLVAEAFNWRSLDILERLQILERYDSQQRPFSECFANCGKRYLWPAYTSDAPNHLVILIATFVGVKQRAHVPIWGEFTYLEELVLLIKSSQISSRIVQKSSRHCSIESSP